MSRIGCNIGHDDESPPTQRSPGAALDPTRDLDSADRRAARYRALRDAGCSSYQANEGACSIDKFRAHMTRLGKNPDDYGSLAVRAKTGPKPWDLPMVRR